MYRSPSVVCLVVGGLWVDGVSLGVFALCMFSNLWAEGVSGVPLSYRHYIIGLVRGVGRRPGTDMITICLWGSREV
jgi:hypothetical protein